MKKVKSGFVIALIGGVALPQNAAAMHIAEGLLPFNWAAFWFAAALPFFAWGLYSLNRRSREDIQATIEVIPGVPSANAAAARLGAPLMLDYATISLSDLLVSWATIRTRLEAVAAADLVVALYNPRSRKRIRQLEEAAEIFLTHRPGGTPVGIATAVGRRDEQTILSDLDHFLNEPIGMRSMVIIGNSASRTARGWFITSRGYRL